jgi:hypothetical protein
MTEILKYEKELGKLKTKLVADCPHESIKYWPDGSGASYYDKAEYWYNLWCADCRKLWSVNQDEKALAPFKNAERVTSRPKESL